MRGLKICLWIAGIGCLASVFGMFLPVSAWECIAKDFGLETLPDSPHVMYAIRLLSAMAVATGVYLIILALDPIKYGVMVPFTGVAAVFLGVVCWIAGPVAKMPVLWYLGDSVSCIVLGVLIIVFWHKIKKSSAASAES